MSALVTCLSVAIRQWAYSTSPIQDCDEVFNFWEPTHYLNHGYGLQTWELSPEYAIRSWLYTTLHAVPIYLISWLPLLNTNKADEWFLMRAMLCSCCLFCEMRFYGALQRSISQSVATIYAIASVSSAGMFHASVSYLPSTFAMYASMLAAAAFLNPEHPDSLSKGLTFLAIGTIIGWPFVAVLAVPFVLAEIYRSLSRRDVAGLARRLVTASWTSLLVLATEVVVDSAFYRKLVCVPFNIIWYNVFSSGKGPSIYGVEPWHFYFRNLLINFNLWFVLALLAIPLLTLQRCFGQRRDSPTNNLTTFVLTTPFYLWLAIFTAQPHKEERFMYPIYPFVASNAAISINVIVLALTSKTEKPSKPASPFSIKTLSIASLLVPAVILGVLRIAGLTTAYNAPLRIYKGIPQHFDQAGNIVITNVCIGKEWYRFPSSYHLPSGARLKFIKSEFSGLLPGEFFESKTWTQDLFPGAHIEPPGMNDENLEDLGKYISPDQCDYLVDSVFDSSQASSLEPHYAEDKHNWQVQECLPFLDAAQTGILGRLFWIPNTDLIPTRFRRKWGQYCLLKAVPPRRDAETAAKLEAKAGK